MDLRIAGKKALMDSARAYVTYHGAVEEWFEHMGMPQSTGYRYKSQLLKEGPFKYLQEKPKSDNKEAIKSRKRREKGSNSHTEKTTPTDDPSSPSITTAIDDYVTNAQSSDTKLSFCEVVPDAQSKMGTSYHGRSKGAVSMGTTNNGTADEEYDEVIELIDRIKTISSRHYRPNQPGTWTEHQWLNLTELYFTMHSIAEGYSRDYKQERRDYADECFKQAATFFDATDGSASNRIGGNA